MHGSHIPFVMHDDANMLVATGAGGDVTRAQFMGDVLALSALLPPGGHMVNLCTDRYGFALGLGAALVKEQMVLLPPNETPIMLQQLEDDYPDLYILTDRPGSRYPAPVLIVPQRLAGTPSPKVLSFPADQPAVTLFTSGSTGRPKPQSKNWGALVESSRAAGVSLAVGALKGAAVLSTVPCQHSYGLESTIMLPLQHELRLTAGRPFFPADVAAALDSVPHPRILVTTPIHLRALVRDAHSLPRADLIVSATATLPVQLAQSAELAFKCQLLEIYGCTEAGQIAWRRPATAPEWNTLDGFVLHQRQGATYAQGPIVDHEIELQDIIELLSPQRFVLHGRTADLVNIAGKRSSLSYLNAHLNAIHGVLDGIFVAPETKGNEQQRLMAFVVAPDLSAATLMTALRQRIDPAFLPRPLHLVEALPRNSLGKLLYEDVQRMIERADAE